MNNQKRFLQTSDMALISMFCALIAICSWISIQLIVPFTMQTFAVFVSVALLGTRRAFITISLYILIGAAGVPVFSGFRGGMSVLMGTTGGYIIGFLFAVIVTGTLIKIFGDRNFILLLAMIAGLIVCYIFGTVWFMYFYARAGSTIGFIAALSKCVFPFIIPDILKISLAVFIYKAIKKRIKIKSDTIYGRYIN